MASLSQSTSKIIRSLGRSSVALSKPQPRRGRSLHTRVSLPYDPSEGLGSFMSAQTLKMLSEDYQQGLLDRLNDLVRGTKEENSSILQTIVSSASVRERALEFNYASEALNNSFFLDTLKPPPPRQEHSIGHELSISEYSDFKVQIDKSFGSLQQLKSMFSGAAMGMFGSGWVWLVTGDDRELAVVATYGSGTVLVRSRGETAALDKLVANDAASAHRRETTRETASELSRFAIPGHVRQMQSPSSSPSSGTSMPDNSFNNSPLYTRSMSHAQDTQSQNTFGSHQMPHKKKYGGGKPEKARSGSNLIPLLTCSVHERSWLPDHGIWGKEQYLTNFWEVVDWRKVAASFDHAKRSLKST